MIRNIRVPCGEEAWEVIRAVLPDGGVREVNPDSVWVGDLEMIVALVIRYRPRSMPVSGGP